MSNTTPPSHANANSNANSNIDSLANSRADKDSPSRAPNRGPLLNHLDEIEAECLRGDPTIGRILSIFGEHGHFVLIFFLNVPFLQPIPLLGLSSIFGTLIAVVGVFAYLRKPPWIPSSWSEKTVAASTVKKIAEGSERVFEKLAFLIHPRLSLLFNEPFRSLNIFLLVLNAILLALPLPIPLSNAIPAWMILFQTLAHLERDGLLIILSYLQTILCLVYFAALAHGALIGFEALIRNWNIF